MERGHEEAKAQESSRRGSWQARWAGAQRGQAGGQPQKMAARAVWSKAARRKSQPGATLGVRGPVAGRNHPSRNRHNPRPVRRLCHWFGKPWHSLCRRPIVESAKSKFLIRGAMEMPMRVRPDFALERGLWGRGVMAVAGVDEVGVGALAGPVIAAAVILAPGTIIKGLADSKLLTAKRREALFAVIAECAVEIGVGRSEVEEVDRINVYWAAMEARRRAVEALPITPGMFWSTGSVVSRAVSFRRCPLSAATFFVRRSRQRLSWLR